jgi:hypothetical protein
MTKVLHCPGSVEVAGASLGHRLDIAAKKTEKAGLCAGRILATAFSGLAGLVAGVRSARSKNGV